ncbi:MAG: MFS transporter [Clostridium sp.]
MLKIFKNSIYKKLFISNFFSSLGSYVATISLMFHLLKEYPHNPSYATTAEMMLSLPVLLIFLFVGLVADKFDRKKVCFYSDMFAALCSVLLLISIIYDVLLFMFMMLFLVSMFQKFFSPSFQSLLQGILDEEDYAVSAGINQMIQSLFTLFGTGISIFIYWHLGINGAIMINTVCFLISGFLIRSLIIKEEVRLPNGKHRISDFPIKKVFAEFLEGFRYTFNNKILFQLILGFVLFGFLNGILAVLPIYTLKYKLAPNVYEEMSIIQGAVMGGGLLLGSFCASLISNKFDAKYLIVIFSILTGICLGICTLSDNLPMFLSMIFLIAFFVPFINIAVVGWVYKMVDPKYMGRVQSIISPTVLLFQALSLGLIAIAYPKWLSLEVLYLVSFILMSIAGVFYLFFLPKQKESKKYLYDKSIV